MFHDFSKEGDVSVTEYESAANHFCLLLSFGKSGPSVKVSPEQGQALHSALLRIYECNPHAMASEPSR